MDFFHSIDEELELRLEKACEVRRVIRKLRG